MANRDGLGRQVWLLVMLRAALMLLAGLAALFAPGAVLTALVWVAGLFFLVDGVLGLWAQTFGGAGTGNFWFDVVRNAFSILMGVLILLSPVIATIVTTTFLVYLVALQALFVGVMEIVMVWRARAVLGEVWPVLAGGVLYVLFALVLILAPVAGALGMVMLGGVLMVLFALALFGLGWRMRRAG